MSASTTHSSPQSGDTKALVVETPTYAASTHAKHWSHIVGAAVLKGLLLFVLLNLVLYVAGLIHRPGKANDPLARYGSEQLQKAYPGWQRDDIRAMLAETFREPAYEYEAFTGFRDKPFRGKCHTSTSIPPDSATRKIRRPGRRVLRPPTFLSLADRPRPELVSDDQTIPSYLQECAAANHPGGHVAVYNFGRTFYFSGQELILFQQLLKRGFIPQVAVFVDGINDFGLSDGEPSFANRFRRLMAGQTNDSWVDHVPVVSAVYSLRARGSKPQFLKEPAPAELQAVVDRWRANKRMIEVIAAGYGVQPVFVWQPAPTYKYDLHYHFLSRRGLPPYGGYPPAMNGYGLMEAPRQRGELGGDVLWLADIQQDKHENLYVDRYHYTAAFSQEIAQRICGFLREHPVNGQPAAQAETTTAQNRGK